MVNERLTLIKSAIRRACHPRRSKLNLPQTHVQRCGPLSARSRHSGSASGSKPLEAEIADATTVHQHASDPTVVIAGEREPVPVTEKMVRSDGCQRYFP